MKYAYVVCIGLFLSALTTALAADTPADAKAIQGTWKPIKAELGGKPMADEVLKTISLKMDNDKYEVVVGEHPDRGTYTIDAAATPKSITVTGTEGPNQGRTFP